MITLDSSALVALVIARDPDHDAVVGVLRGERQPFLVPAGTLCEAAYIIGSRLGRAALDGLLADLQEGRYQLDCGEEDFLRVRQLMSRYDDLRLGFADAAVIACAERNGGRVLTLDTRDFGVVAREGRITVLP